MDLNSCHENLCYYSKLCLINCVQFHFSEFWKNSCDAGPYLQLRNNSSLSHTQIQLIHTHTHTFTYTYSFTHTQQIILPNFFKGLQTQKNISEKNTFEVFKLSMLKMLFL